MQRGNFFQQNIRKCSQQSSSNTSPQNSHVTSDSLRQSRSQTFTATRVMSSSQHPKKSGKRPASPGADSLAKNPASQQYLPVRQYDLSVVSRLPPHILEPPPRQPARTSPAIGGAAASSSAAPPANDFYKLDPAVEKADKRLQLWLLLHGMSKDIAAPSNGSLDGIDVHAEVIDLTGVDDEDEEIDPNEVLTKQAKAFAESMREFCSLAEDLGCASLVSNTARRLGGCSGAGSVDSSGGAGDFGQVVAGAAAGGKATRTDVLGAGNKGFSSNKGAGGPVGGGADAVIAGYIVAQRFLLAQNRLTEENVLECHRMVTRVMEGVGGANANAAAVPVAAVPAVAVPAAAKSSRDPPGKRASPKAPPGGSAPAPANAATKTTDLPGKLRTSPARVGRHLFPAADQLSSLFPKLIEAMNHVVLGRQDVSLYTKAAFCLTEVCSLHPFADGNGRVARILVNWALQRGNDGANSINGNGGGGLPFLVNLCASSTQRKEYSLAIRQVQVGGSSQQEKGRVNPVPGNPGNRRNIAGGGKKGGPKENAIDNNEPPPKRPKKEQTSIPTSAGAPAAAPSGSPPFPGPAPDNAPPITSPGPPPYRNLSIITKMILAHVNRCWLKFEKLHKQRTLSNSEKEKRDQESDAMKLCRERARREEDCSICFDEKPTLSVLCCGAVYHMDCLARWLSQPGKNTCAHCRGEIPNTMTELVRAGGAAAAVGGGAGAAPLPPDDDDTTMSWLEFFDELPEFDDSGIDLDITTWTSMFPDLDDEDDLITSTMLHFDGTSDLDEDVTTTTVYDLPQDDGLCPSCGVNQRARDCGLEYCRACCVRTQADTGFVCARHFAGAGG